MNCGCFASVLDEDILINDDIWVEELKEIIKEYDELKNTKTQKPRWKHQAQMIESANDLNKESEV